MLVEFRKKFRLVSFQVPLIIIFSMATVTLLSYQYVHKQSHRDNQREMENRVRDRLHQIQRLAETLLNNGLRVSLYSALSGMYSEPELLDLLVVTSDGKVATSNNFAHIGKDWRSIEAGMDELLVKETVAKRQTVVRSYEENGYVDGYIRLCDRASSNQLRNRQCGFAFYRIDLLYNQLVTDQALRQQNIVYFGAMIVIVMLILLVLYLKIARPVNNINLVLERFSNGEREVRANVKGDSELAGVAGNLNATLELVVANEKDIAKREMLFRSVFDTTIDMIVIMDENRCITHINRAVQQFLGYSEDELIGRSVNTIIPPGHRERHDQYVKDYLFTGVKKVIGKGRELTAQTKAGNELPIQLAVTEMFVDERRSFVGVLHDISVQTALKKAIEEANRQLLSSNLELKDLSRTDALTGIANRGYFDEFLGLEIHRAKRTQEPLSLILIDIDYFKNYNDFYGHQQGDDCLVEVARQLKIHFQRATDLVARYGGEEFAIILPDTEPRYADQLAHSLCDRIERCGLPHEKSRIARHVTISVGVATVLLQQDEKLDNKTLINLADQALYEAKGAGRNRVCRYHPD